MSTMSESNYLKLMDRIREYNEECPDAELTCEGNILYSCGAKVDYGDCMYLISVIDAFSPCKQ